MDFLSNVCAYPSEVYVDPPSRGRLSTKSGRQERKEKHSYLLLLLPVDMDHSRGLEFHFQVQ